MATVPSEQGADRAGELLALAARWARSLDIDAASARVVTSGWDFEVLLARATWTGSAPPLGTAPPAAAAAAAAGQQDWAFRFPRRPEVAELLEVELRLLPVLAPKLPVAVPQPAVVGLLDDGEHRFAGYPVVPGEPLRPALVTGGRGGLVVSQLAGFLAALHAMSVREVAAAGVPLQTMADWRASLADVVERGSAVLRAAMGAAATARLESGWLATIGDDRCWPDEVTVVHGDLGVEHVLADPTRCVVTGVIDWTDARIADPAMDFADLATGLGRDGLLRVVEAYADASDRSVDEHFLDRVALYRALMPLHTALHGEATGQPSHIGDAVRALTTAERAVGGAG
jgi:macrolide phosphotransferase